MLLMKWPVLEALCSERADVAERRVEIVFGAGVVDDVEIGDRRWLECSGRRCRRLRC